MGNDQCVSRWHSRFVVVAYCVVVFIGGCVPLDCNPLIAQSESTVPTSVDSLEDAKKLPASVRRVAVERVADDTIGCLVDRGGLEYIELSRVRHVTVSSLKNLCSLSGLRELRLSKCSGVDEEVARAIASNGDLERICLSACEPATTSAIATILGSTSLKRVELKHMTGVNEESLKACSPTSNIVDLQLDLGGHVDDEALEALARLPKLRRLGVVSPWFGDDSIAKLKDCKSLKMLDLECEASGTFTEVLFATVMIEEMRLTFCHGIRMDMLDFSKAKALRVLVLPSLVVRPEDSLDCMSSLTSLEELHLGGNRSMSGRWEKLSKVFGKLTTLSIPSTDVADGDMIEIAKMPTLKDLRLNGCNGITKKGLMELVKLPKLTALHLELCKGIDREDALVFKKAKPSCRIVGYSFTNEELESD